MIFVLSFYTHTHTYIYILPNDFAEGSEIFLEIILLEP